MLVLFILHQNEILTRPQLGATMVTPKSKSHTNRLFLTIFLGLTPPPPPNKKNKKKNQQSVSKYTPKYDTMVLPINLDKNLKENIETR